MRALSFPLPLHVTSQTAVSGSAVVHLTPKMRPLTLHLLLAHDQREAVRCTEEMSSLLSICHTDVPQRCPAVGLGRPEHSVSV